MEGFTNGSGCHFENIRSSAKRFRLWIVYSELKRHNVSHYIYYLATDNIHIVLENDNTVLIKGLKKVVNVKFSKKHILWNVPVIGWNQEKSHLTIQRKSC